MKVYRLLKELPWAEAGSEWVIACLYPTGNVFLENPNNESEHMLWHRKWGFESWFEEKKPEVKFSAEQIEVISKVLRNSICHSGVDTVDTFLEQIENYTV